MKPAPDEEFGPRMADILDKLSEAVCQESGASVVYVQAEWVFRNDAKKGRLKLNIRVSPDSKTERLGKTGQLRWRGHRLQVEADQTIRKMWEDLR